MIGYKKTPLEIGNVLRLLSSKKVPYILFKCEHIFAGKNSNVDILIEKGIEYTKAGYYLEKEGFVLYMSEKVEKYKRMYVKLINNEVYAIHLHREVAWHGIKVLDKKGIFARKKKVNSIITIPSSEDSLLIHTAHILFENFKIREREKEIISSCLAAKLDWNYINWQLRKNGWKKGFYDLLNKITRNKKPLMADLVHNYLRKMVHSPSQSFYLLKKVLRSKARNFSLRRKGLLITLVGVNGSGKTSLARKTLQAYKPLTNFAHGQFGYYFGWEPFLPSTKLLSRVLKSRNRKIFNDLNQQHKPFSIWKELIFIYNYVEYLARYLYFIYPQLRKNKLVVTDRYFYDLYAQYSSAAHSKILPFMFSIYPKPDYLFVLDANVQTIEQRDKNTEVFSRRIVASAKRKVHERGYLLDQKKRYGYLAKVLKGELLNTEKPINQNADRIITKTWTSVLKK